MAKATSAIFITFSGNCNRALNFYHTCFGGLLQFETFEKEMQGYPEKPIVSGVLVSDRITIYGSDLVPEEGRSVGNYISIFLPCKNADERKLLIGKLEYGKKNGFHNDDKQKLVEILDAFDIRWILAID